MSTLFRTGQPMIFTFHELRFTLSTAANYHHWLLYFMFHASRDRINNRKLID